MKRDQPVPRPRYFFSTYGISSFTIASPYGPLLAEFTAYESS